MPIRRNLIPNDSWETILSWILVERALDMAGGPVSTYFVVPFAE